VGTGVNNRAVIWPKLSPDGTKIVWSQMLEAASKEAPNGRWAIMLADIDLEAASDKEVMPDGRRYGRALSSETTAHVAVPAASQEASAAGTPALSNVRSWQDPDGLPAFYECYGWVPTTSDKEVMPNGARIREERSSQSVQPTVVAVPAVSQEASAAGTLIFASTTRATTEGPGKQQLWTLPDSLPAQAPLRISPPIEPEMAIIDEYRDVLVDAMKHLTLAGRRLDRLSYAKEAHEAAERVRVALIAVKPADTFHEWAYFPPGEPRTLYTAIGAGVGGDDVFAYTIPAEGITGLLPQPTRVTGWNGRWVGLRVEEVPGYGPPKTSYIIKPCGDLMVTTTTELVGYQTVDAWRIAP
jgi:hypothetical protein